MTCPAVIEVVTPGPPGPPGPPGSGSTTLTGPAVLGRSEATPGFAVALPLGTGLSIVDGALTATGATGATNLSYDPATRLLSSSTGADVTLPLVSTTAAGLVPSGWLTGAEAAILPHIHGDLAGTLYFHVKNTSGGTLTKGAPVSVVGAVGDTTTLEVVATNPGVAGRTHAHGLLYSELANNGFGHAVVLGELQGVNTAALAPASPLWVATAGGTTGTRPATAAQQVATVGRQHATTGTLLVSIEGVEPTPAQIGAMAAPIPSTYTASGAILVSDKLALINSSSAAAMTIGSGTTNGQTLTIKRYGAGPVTVTANLDGVANASIIADSATIKESVMLAWSAGLSTWLVL